MKPLYRTLLMIGIAMGVVATSLIFGIGQGLVIHIQESNEIAEDMYAIYQPSGSAGVMGMSLPSVREIQRWLPEDIATSVISLEQREVDVQIGSDFYDAHIIGVDADLAQVFGLAITQGEFFTRDDQENRNPVCVVTNDLVELLVQKHWNHLLSMVKSIRSSALFRAMSILVECPTTTTLPAVFSFRLKSGTKSSMMVFMTMG